MNRYIDPLYKKRNRKEKQAFDRLCRELAGPVVTTHKKERNMALKLNEVKTLDKNSGRGSRQRDVRYTKVLKSNRKALANVLPGVVHDLKDGSFKIKFVAKVNGDHKDLEATTGDVLFQTGDSDRWQIMTKKGFQKRFPEVKI